MSYEIFLEMLGYPTSIRMKWSCGITLSHDYTHYKIELIAKLSYGNDLPSSEIVKYFEGHALELSEDDVCQNLHSEVLF